MCIPNGGVQPPTENGAVNTSPRAIGLATIPKPDPTIVGLAPRIGNPVPQGAK